MDREWVNAKKGVCVLGLLQRKLSADEIDRRSSGHCGVLGSGPQDSVTQEHSDESLRRADWRGRGACVCSTQIRLAKGLLFVHCI